VVIFSKRCKALKVSYDYRFPSICHEEILAEYDSHVPQKIVTRLQSLLMAFENDRIVQSEIMENRLLDSRLHSEAKGGLILSTSGTKGERKWVFHPWENLRNRITSLHRPNHSSAIFLSLEHAAGIESLFRYYLGNVDCGVYPPSCSVDFAFKSLEAQKPSCLSTTPSTFLRFISYPLLKRWLIENLKEINFGGEVIPEELVQILKRDFSNTVSRSIFGSTETWSVQTINDESLQFHKINDPFVKKISKGKELILETSFLFTHYFDGIKLVENQNSKWATGDEIEVNDFDQFRIIKNNHKKFHGMKIFPEEWEHLLKRNYGLEWVQLSEVSSSGRDPFFIAILPSAAEKMKVEIQEEFRIRNWPVVKWSFQNGPPTTNRGKLSPSVWRNVTADEIKEMASQDLRRDDICRYLESYTWDNESIYKLYQSKSGFVFYKDSPIRRYIQYSFADVGDLIKILNEIQDSVIMKFYLNETLELENWSYLGKYVKWSVDLSKWRKPPVHLQNIKVEHYYQTNKFDSYLMGKELQLLETLADCYIVYGEDQFGSGLCAYRIIDGNYVGMYLANKGLKIREFMILLGSSLESSKAIGAKFAEVNVDEDNKNAEFIHKLIGFSKTSNQYSLWSRKKS
jgi:hypothetical protein